MIVVNDSTVIQRVVVIVVNTTKLISRLISNSLNYTY